MKILCFIIDHNLNLQKYFFIKNIFKIIILYKIYKITIDIFNK